MNHQIAAQRAIKAALAGKWNEAIEYNLQILKSEPENIEALNRLAKAYAAIDQTKNAKKTWNKVLRLDPYNSIATGQLEKLKSRGKKASTTTGIQTNAQLFLDEPGKTKTTQLVRLTNPSSYNNLEPGQPVMLVAKKRSVSVQTNSGEYLGALPDDLSLCLIKRIKAGNKYEALIRRSEKNSLHVFIKEVKRAKRYQNTPTFSRQTNATIANLEPQGPINESPIDIAPTGEEHNYKES